MKKIYLHIGFPKCASTSFQNAMSNNKLITYPNYGRHLNEHLAIPLKLKGIDTWTSQWYSSEWVDTEYVRIIDEVRRAIGVVVISSERLMDLNEDQINILKNSFEHNFELLIFSRPFESWVSSMWRHAVFIEDLCVSYEDFKKNYDCSHFRNIITNFKKSLIVHEFDITSDTFSHDLSILIGSNVDMRFDNVGVSVECCNYLYKLHSSVGSNSFKKYFNLEQKKIFSQMFSSADGKINEFKVPI